MAQKRIPSSEAFQRITLSSSAWPPRPAHPAVSHSDANAVQTTQPCIFYVCNKPIFRSLSCVSLNHNIPIEKNLIVFFLSGEIEGRRKKKFITKMLFLLWCLQVPLKSARINSGWTHEKWRILSKICIVALKSGYPENICPGIGILYNFTCYWVLPRDCWNTGWDPFGLSGPQISLLCK